MIEFDCVLWTFLRCYSTVSKMRVVCGVALDCVTPRNSSTLPRSQLLAKASSSTRRFAVHKFSTAKLRSQFQISDCRRAAEAGLWPSGEGCQSRPAEACGKTEQIGMSILSTQYRPKKMVTLICVQCLYLYMFMTDFLKQIVCPAQLHSLQWNMHEPCNNPILWNIVISLNSQLAVVSTLTSWPVYGLSACQYRCCSFGHIVAPLSTEKILQQLWLWRQYSLCRRAPPWPCQTFSIEGSLWLSQPLSQHYFVCSDVIGSIIPNPSCTVRAWSKSPASLLIVPLLQFWTIRETHWIELFPICFYKLLKNLYCLQDINNSEPLAVTHFCVFCFWYLHAGFRQKTAQVRRFSQGKRSNTFCSTSCLWCWRMF